MKFLAAILAIAIAGCSKHHPAKTPPADARTDDLRTLFYDKQQTALALRSPANGWLTPDDCDGMIWSAKYAATSSGVQITAAEYPADPGKWSRRPFPACWDGSDKGAATTWSRDMAIAGLIPYAFLTGDRALLERHAGYVRAHDWVSGEPLADGRVVYTPALIGLLYKTIHAMGGAQDANALWPDVYTAGLTDYQAHLQVMSIWLRGEVAAMMHDDDAVPKQPGSPVVVSDDGEWRLLSGGRLGLLDISESMYLRLQEHATGEPGCALYAYVYGRYTGDQSHTLDLLLDPAAPACDYVRCNEPERCKLAEWLFTTYLLLRDSSPGGVAPTPG